MSDLCWICLDESKKKLCSLGCLCKRFAHDDCAYKWYSNKIQQYAYKKSIHADWIVQTFIVCETCKGCLSSKVTTQWVQRVQYPLKHPSNYTIIKPDIDTLLSFVLITLFCAHIFWIVFIFQLVPELCVIDGDSILYRIMKKI